MILIINPEVGTQHGLNMEYLWSTAVIHTYLCGMLIDCDTWNHMAMISGQT